MAVKGRMTIRALAAQTGVSVCTVNNALNGRGRMSDATRQKVLEAIEASGYRPNRMAQALARNPIRMVVFHPDVWPGFYGPLVEGVVSATQDLSDRKVTGSVHVLPVKADAKELLDTVRAAAAVKGYEKVGFILCPGGDDWPVMAEYLEAQGIPVVLLGIDMPVIKRVSLVRHDAYRSGQIAASLLAPMTNGRPAAIIIGSLRTGDHQDKVNGFQDEAARLRLPIAGIFEAEDEPGLAYPVTDRIVHQNPGLGGIYVASDNSEGVCRYIRERRLASRISLGLTGVFDTVREALEDGTARFTLFQRMTEQGRLAARTLYRFMAEGFQPEPEILIPPLIATRANMDVIGAGAGGPG